ncbi:hypothetical protein GCM10023147_23240 [Tsukamurella soli]|uniref:Uncharacterized protein n=1 Tax=Tsukamurella soli TaxID=644556 RepID=A0ABP8JM18_9ACTN
MPCRRSRRGIFSGGPAVDLDLACLYEVTDGRKGIVQALGNAFGDVERAPCIRVARVEGGAEVAAVGGQDETTPMEIAVNRSRRTNIRITNYAAHQHIRGTGPVRPARVTLRWRPFSANFRVSDRADPL